VLFAVKDDDEESTCQTDSVVSHSAASLTPAMMFAADSGTVTLPYGACVLLLNAEASSNYYAQCSYSGTVLLW